MELHRIDIAGNGAPVEVLHVTGTTKAVARHYHDSGCIGIVETGRRAYRSGGTLFRLTAGELFVIGPGTIHECGPTDASYSSRLLCIPPSTAAALCPDRALFPSTIVLLRNKALLRRFASLHRLMENAPSLLAAESALAEALARLFARCGTLPPVQAPDCATARVYEYLAGHFAEEIPLARLAAVASLSPFHLVRRFTLDRGLSPHACQTLLRVQAAKRLLKAGRSPAEAALETGFFDQSHFHRHFRRLVGMTPGRYAGRPR